MGEYIFEQDTRTVGFTEAEFGNAWAVHRGEQFGTNDLDPFQREWQSWLAARDAALLADAQPSEWESVKWHQLQADDDDGNPVGDIIRLAWDDGTAVIGRLTVPSVGSGHHQVCRMQTTFGGDTYVWPHGATLARKVASSTLSDRVLSEVMEGRSGAGCQDACCRSSTSPNQQGAEQ